MEQRLGITADAKPVAPKPINSTVPLGAFLGRLDRAFRLPEAQRAAIRDDFTLGIDALSARGVPLSEIIRRLDPERLHGFYAQTPQGFFPLDNGAKQYPLAMLNGRMAVFRLTAALDAPVEPALLQLALTFVLRRFPHYATRLRRGAFWYYLMPCTARYAVAMEGTAAFRETGAVNGAQPLFRVTYKGCSVSAELNHILTDGMGGMIFLKSLLAEYYRLLGEETTGMDLQILDAAAPSPPGDVENGFTRFHSRKRGDGLIGAPAVQLPAEPLPDGYSRVDQYLLSAAALREAARRYGVTVTGLMSAVILQACRDTARAERGRYRLQVTFDLRRIFGGRTLRNFSWFGTLTSDAADALRGTGLAADLHRQLKAMTSRDALERNVSQAQRVIRRLGIVPLQWKTAVLRSVYRMTGNFFFTSTLSNLGVIPLYGPLQSHVREVAAVLGPSPGNPYSFALSTAHNRAILSVTRTTDDRTMLARLEESARAFGLALTKKG